VIGGQERDYEGFFRFGCDWVRVTEKTQEIGSSMNKRLPPLLHSIHKEGTALIVGVLNFNVSSAAAELIELKSEVKFYMLNPAQCRKRGL